MLVGEGGRETAAEDLLIMHELEITPAAWLKLALDEAEKSNAKKLTSVNVVVLGEMSER
jgi:hypothetical protein